MRKLHYKGRCVKRSLSKCKDICRTYDKIQTAFADWLQENDDIISFQCNVKIENSSEDQYTSDFYAGRGTSGEWDPDEEEIWKCSGGGQGL